MGTKEEWCADKLSKLLNEDLRITTLNEIKEHFQEISNTEAVQTAELLELPLVFDCLNDSNKEQVDLACEVLSLCMEKLDIVETTTRYTVPLERALTHPNPGVKIMALEEISRILKCEPHRKQQMVNDLSKRSLFINIVKCIGDPELNVASSACTIIACFGSIDVDCLLYAEVLKCIKQTMGINEVVRLRFYEVFVDICISSNNSHNKVVSAGLLNPIMHEITSNDVLLRLNIIEMLYKLVECDYGYEYLKTEGFMDNIFKQFSKDADPVFLQLCEPGILKFFGHMAHCKPNEVFNKFPFVTDRVFNNLESGDYTILKVSLETIAYISSADKTILDSFVGTKMIRAIRLIINRLSTLPTKEKVIALSWFEEIIKSPLNENDSQIAFKWFSSLGPNPMDVIMHYIRNPFEELRLAGLGVLQSIIMHKWGHESVRDSPGLIEYLLDRSIETSKRVKDQKYSIIKYIESHNFNVFDHATATRFDRFVKEGPHYVVAVTEVAVDGDD